MFCATCGTKYAIDSNFCKQCGSKLEKATSRRISEDEFDRSLPESEYINALLERAYRSVKTGETEQAIALCQEALQKRPDSSSAHSLLGQIYENLGDRAQALREYERVLELNPGSIADRIKLDQLRDGAHTGNPLASHVPGRDTSRPRSTYSDPRSRTNTGVVIAGTMAAVALVLLGCAFGLVWRGEAAPRSNTSPANTLPTSAPLANSTAQKTETQVAANNSGAVTKTDPATVPPTNSAGGSPVSMWPPAIIYAPQPQSQQLSGAQQIPAGTNDHSTSLPTIQGVPAVKNDKKPKPPVKQRIVLAPDDSEAGSNVTIKVDKTSDTQPNGGGIIDIKNAKPSQTPLTGSRDARSYIELGNELKTTGDYVHAIASYTKALPTAGDDLGMVYQEIAACYQKRGDKASAITNYNAAITEYQRLASAGKQAEAAQDGIRACERAIKACSF